MIEITIKGQIIDIDEIRAMRVYDSILTVWYKIGGIVSVEFESEHEATDIMEALAKLNDVVTRW